MSSNNGYNAPRPPKTILNDAKHKLYTRNSQGKNATLQGDVTDRGNPRLTVWTNLEGDVKSITAPLEPMGVHMLLDRLEDLATGVITDGTPKHLQIAKPGWNNQTKKKEGEVITNQVYVGRDDTGAIFISVKETDGKVVLKFQIKPSSLNKWMHKSGEEFSVEEASNVATRALVRIWRKGFEEVMFERITRAVNEERKDGNGGGYNNNRGNGGGQRRDNPDAGMGADDDIQW